MSPLARVLAPGAAEGPVLVLSEPISFWGGVDPRTGAIIESRHPQAGVTVTGTVLVLARSRGSSSASSVLAEMIRLGTAPAGIVVQQADPVIVAGSIVAARLYQRRMPVVLADEEVVQELDSARHARLDLEGVLVWQ